MGKLKTIGIGLLMGAKALMSTETQGQLVEVNHSGAPIVGAIPGASFKVAFGNESAGIQPFVRAGVQGVFIGDKWRTEMFHRVYQESREWELSVPRWSASVGAGANIRVSDNHKLFGSLNVFSSPGYMRGRAEAGLSSNLNFLSTDNVRLLKSVFYETIGINDQGTWLINPNAVSRRTGIGVGLRHDRILTDNLNFFVKMGYNHSFFKSLHGLTERGAHIGEFTGDVGFRLRINPRLNRNNLGFGGCPPIHHLRHARHQAIPQMIQPHNCTAVRGRPRDRSSREFNHPARSGGSRGSR
ncbi:MAG: autotransporter outer membrane beta-barrel domain-containing protein [Bacteroidales bacterium]|nr:autotransporter outer membrane beta-barrel domain-containing protein [Bacteroidales bacterium]